MEQCAIRSSRLLVSKTAHFREVSGQTYPSAHDNTLATVITCSPGRHSSAPGDNGRDISGMDALVEHDSRTDDVTVMQRSALSAFTIDQGKSLPRSRSLEFVS